MNKSSPSVVTSGKSSETASDRSLKQAPARSTRVDPNSFASLFNHGVQLRKQKQYAAARICYERALAMRDDDAQLWSNYGNLLCDLFLFDEAEAAHARALALDENSVGRLYNYGVVPFKDNRPAQAIEIFERVLAADPKHHSAAWNRALSYLQLGDYVEGFAGYEHRLDRDDMQRDFSGVPLWRGEPLQDKRILVASEQGLGDMIQFVRFVQALKAQGAEVFLEAPTRLKRFMFCVQGVDHVVDCGDLRHGYDFYIRAMSLPHRLGVSMADLSNTQTYIDADRFIAPRALPGKQALKVGLVWGSKPGHPVQRSCTLQDFAPLLAQPGVDFYSFQKGEAVDDIDRLGLQGLIYDLDEYMTDFYDTAACMKQMDLVISIDSSPLHCAAALGVKTWGLLLHAAEWRWLLDRDDSPWYPSLKLYRQHAHEDWSGVMRNLAEDFADFVRR